LTAQVIRSCRRPGECPGRRASRLWRPRDEGKTMRLSAFLGVDAGRLTHGGDAACSIPKEQCWPRRSSCAKRSVLRLSLTSFGRKVAGRFIASVCYGSLSHRPGSRTYSWMQRLGLLTEKSNLLIESRTASDLSQQDATAAELVALRMRWASPCPAPSF